MPKISFNSLYNRGNQSNVTSGLKEKSNNIQTRTLTHSPTVRNTKVNLLKDAKLIGVHRVMIFPLHKMHLCYSNFSITHRVVNQSKDNETLLFRVTFGKMRPLSS